MNNQKIPNFKVLVLVGAGHANVQVLKHLSMNKYNGLEVILVNDGFSAVYSGMTPGLIENYYKIEEAIIDLPLNVFMQDGKLVDQVVVGNLLPLQDDKGNVLPSTVVSINEETVTMDANHPLAGQDLHFTGSIVEVREATAEEIDSCQVKESGCCENC